MRTFTKLPLTQVNKTYKLCLLSALLLIGVLINPIYSQDIPNDDNCLICASLQSYPQLASVDSDEGSLSELLINQMLESDIDLTALNWQGLAQSDLSLLDFFDALLVDLNLSSPEQVLGTALTMSQIIDAMIVVADNAGTIASLNQIANATLSNGTIQLEDLFEINTINNDLADVKLDFFSLLMGCVQLYNYENVAVTNSPATINIPTLGEVQIQAQVVEPPNIVCAESSVTLYSAGVRLKLDVDLIDEIILNTTVDLSIISSADVSATLTEIELYADIASGEATMTKVDGVNGQSSLTATPGIAKLFLGSISESDFFDRNKNPIDYLEKGTIGSVSLTLNGVPLNALNLTAESSGEASNGAVNIVDVAVPYNQTIGSSSTAINNLISDLLTNTDIELTSNLAPISIVTTIIGLITNDLLNTLNTTLFASGAIADDLAINLIDPLLSSLGVGIGEIIIENRELIESCFDFGDAPNTYGTLTMIDGAGHVIDENIYLGTTAPDSDPDGQPGANADEDMGDDSVIFFPPTIIGDTYSLNVITTYLGSDSAQVIGWIDFNGDNAFNDTYERSVITTQGNVTPGANQIVTLTWENLPVSSSVEETYARIRLSTDPMFFNPSTATSSSVARDGEVEDYYVQNAILPLRFISTEVNNNGAYNTISWEVTEEVNVSDYNVEFSTDGLEFISVANIDYADNNNQYNNYSYDHFIDEGSSELYYRIVAQDLDGSKTYSNVMSLYVDGENKLSISPNPCNEYVELKLNSTDTRSIDIVVQDNMSRKVNSESRIINNGINHLRLNTEYLNSGIYYLTVYNNSKVETKRIIVSK